MSLSIVGTPNGIDPNTAALTVAVSGLQSGDKILVAWRYRNLQTVVSATALGNAMSLLGSQIVGNFMAQQWREYTVQGGDPSSGNIVLTIDTASRQGAQVWVLRGWDTVGTPANVSTTGTSITQDVSSQTGSLVIAAGLMEGEEAITEGAGQTERQDTHAGMPESYFASDEPGGATVTMSHSWTSSVPAIQSAINITAAADAGPPSFGPFLYVPI